MEAVVGVGIDDEIRSGLAGRLQGRLHLRDGLAERVLAGIKAQHRSVEGRGKLHRPKAIRVRLGVVGGRQAAVPGDTSLEIVEFFAGQPGYPAAPAEPRDRHLRGVDVALRLQELQGGGDVAIHLLIGGRVDDLHDLGELAHRQGRRVASTDEEGWGHGHIAQLGKPAADILDVVVDAENLRHHQHDRKTPLAGRPRQISWNRPVGGGQHHRFGDQPGFVGVNGIGVGGEGGGGIAGEEDPRDPPPRQMIVLRRSAFGAGKSDHRSVS